MCRQVEHRGRSPSSLTSLPLKHIPFEYEGSKAAFGAKVFVFLLSGFSIPWVASYYQMYVRDSAVGDMLDLYSPPSQSEVCWRRINKRRLGAPS
jgi:cytochrome c oxidase subunit 7c